MGAEWRGSDPQLTGVSSLGDPSPGALLFATGGEHVLPSVRAALTAGAIVVTTQALADAVGGTPTGAVLVVEKPRFAFAQIVRSLMPRDEAFVAPSAQIASTASVDPSATIGPFTVIGEGVRIGVGTRLGSGVVIGRDVRIGAGLLVQSNSVIGEEGFGTAKDGKGNYIQMPHLGSVVIGDNVHVGALTTVNSGVLEPTVIGELSKVSDHVHIAHNCHIGSSVLIAAGVTLSGSVRVADRVWLGLQSSVKEHVSIGYRSVLGMGSTALKNIPEREVWAGSPARYLRDHRGNADRYN